MANDRDRTNDIEQPGALPGGRQRDMEDESVRGGAGEDVRSIADEEDEEFEDAEELEDEEEDEGSF